jgi:hypothetical protein
MNDITLEAEAAVNVEQEEALTSIKKALLPHVGELLDGFAELLGDLPPEDIDPAIYGGVGKTLVATLEQTAPQLSEAARWSYSYAVCEMLRERLKRTTAPMIAPSEQREDDDGDKQEH